MVRAVLLVVVLLAGCSAPGPGAPAAPSADAGGEAPAPPSRNASAPFVPRHGDVALVLVREAYVVEGATVEDRVSGHCSNASFDGETFTLETTGAPPPTVLFRDVDAEGPVRSSGSSPVARGGAFPASWTLVSPFDRSRTLATIVAEHGRVEVDGETVAVGASLARAVDHVVATPDGNASVRGNLTVTNAGVVPIQTSEPHLCE